VIGSILRVGEEFSWTRCYDLMIAILSYFCIMARLIRRRRMLYSESPLRYPDDEYQCDLKLYDTKAFKATMVYTDPPVSETSSNLLGNDIDMTIKIEGSSSVLYPNGLDLSEYFIVEEQVRIVTTILNKSRFPRENCLKEEW